MATENPALRNELYATVAKAVGRRFAPDIVDDAISDIVLQIMEGKITVDNLRTETRRLTNRTLNAWASRFSPYSLDEYRDGEDGYTLYGSIADDRQMDDMRIVELTVIAERMGIDVKAVLNSEGEERVTWSTPKSRKTSGTLASTRGRTVRSRDAEAAA